MQIIDIPAVFAVRTDTRENRISMVQGRLWHHAADDGATIGR
ncbi:hypothetical protein [Marinicella meishanensis]|nr:hypothetical protein [Marinicella sp. NBU2979]